MLYQLAIAYAPLHCTEEGCTHRTPSCPAFIKVIEWYENTVESAAAQGWDQGQEDYRFDPERGNPYEVNL